MKLTIILLMFFLYGCDSYEIEVQKRDRYCVMVKDGSWPAYDSDIKCENLEIGNGH